MHKKMFAGIIYKGIEPHDFERPEYDCYCPVEYANATWLGDCMVCDEKGNAHPELCFIPVHVDSLGEVVGNFYQVLGE